MQMGLGKEVIKFLGDVTGIHAVTELIDYARENTGDTGKSVINAIIPGYLTGAINSLYLDDSNNWDGGGAESDDTTDIDVVQEATSVINSLIDAINSQEAKQYYQKYDIPQEYITQVRDALRKSQTELQRNIERQNENTERRQTVVSGINSQVVGGQRKHLKQEMRKLDADRKTLAANSVAIAEQQANHQYKLDTVNDILSTPVSDENTAKVMKSAADIGTSVVTNEYEASYSKTNPELKQKAASALSQISALSPTSEGV